MRVLTLNTYAGSMLIGAKAFGAELIGSYEDVGFGQEIAKANFPEVNHIQRWADWPARDLSDVVVLAHPPCSAFSVQNSSWNARGENAAAFNCTRRVLDYAMSNRAKAIAIESVVGALGGAWYVHQSYAQRYGYNLYRILQNGCAFGPQWRERFWVVYVREDVAPPSMAWRLRPRWTRVRDALNGLENDPVLPEVDRALASFKARLWEGGLTPEQMAALFDKRDPPYPSTGVLKVLHDDFFPDWEVYDVGHKFDILFSSSQMCYLNPDGLAGVLLGGTWWYYEGRNLSISGYKRIMGFPTDYVFPQERRDYLKAMRTFLSKGVIPQVATWILGNIATQVGSAHPLNCSCQACEDAPAWELEIEPNHIGDFRFRKKDWMKKDLPELRHYYESEEEMA